MILTETTNIRISNQNLGYYRGLGYDNVEYGKTLMVSTCDLPKGSHYPIVVKCDVCGNESSMQYRNYKGDDYLCPKCDLLNDTKLRLDSLTDFAGIDIRILRRYFIYKSGNTCSVCGTKVWDGKDIPLILDHVDGNSDNWNRINLRVVCPNCDALLPTWKGRNRGHGRTNRRLG